MNRIENTLEDILNILINTSNDQRVKARLLARLAFLTDDIRGRICQNCETPGPCVTYGYCYLCERCSFRDGI